MFPTKIFESFVTQQFTVLPKIPLFTGDQLSPLLVEIKTPLPFCTSINIFSLIAKLNIKSLVKPEFISVQFAQLYR
jgi:hypothetical protein